MDFEQILRNWLASGKPILPDPDPEQEPDEPEQEPEETARDRFWRAWRMGDDVDERAIGVRFDIGRRLG